MSELSLKFKKKYFTRGHHHPLAKVDRPTLAVIWPLHHWGRSAGRPTLAVIWPLHHWTAPSLEATPKKFFLTTR